MAAFQNSCDNSAIVRRFGTARFRILLHLQAEVADIEEELDKLDASDEKTGPDSELDLRYRLRYNVRKLGCGDPAQEKLIERLKEKLAEYDEWVQRDHALRSLPAASEFDYMNLFNWVWGNQPLADGHYDFMLRSDDFVHLSGKKEAGIAERFIFNSCLRRWPRFRLMQSRKHDQGSTQVNEVFFFSESRIALAAKLLSVCVAVTVLMIPVFLLYLTKMDPKAISIIVLMFVLAFATIVSLFTDAKMETVFVGTCA
ncbi:hypothetical protein BKA64DRAFT_60032 [Cadophora sp. MPI-SDFR-AT-0126]|nr:hypothetical protein BKA64DRAFT_60032 [Leotiomycetes sp. MPI-SDFR-AT-0126]